MRYQRRRRAGFTIVEMMVATALVLVIMLIISQAFASGAKTFRNMKAAGDGQEKLRGAATILRKDLASDHIGPPYGSARGGPRVSDQRLDQAGWQPPFRGYFEFRQFGELTGGASILEPTLNPITDGERLTSTRATRHVLRTTVHLPEGPPTELFTARYDPIFAVNPRANSFINQQGLLYTRWAEVVYFLAVMEDTAYPIEPVTGRPLATTNADGSGLYRHTLRRRVRLMPPQNIDLAPMPLSAGRALVLRLRAQYPDVVPAIVPFPPVPQPQGEPLVIVRLPGPEALNLPDLDYTPVLLNPQNSPVPMMRFGGMTMQPHPISGMAIPTHPFGDDIVITDVISFDVKAAWFNNPVYNQLVAGSSPFSSPAVQPGAALPTIMANPPGSFYFGQNMDEPFSDLFPSVLRPLDGRAFDTGTRTHFPPRDPSDWDHPGPGAQQSSELGFLTQPQNAASPPWTTVPTRINVRTLQIKLRVWNPKFQQARQVTLVVEI